LPPLCHVSAPTGPEVHDVDAIFLQPGGTMRVVGHETLDGRKAIRLEHACLKPSDEPHREPGELLAGDVITAWLDPRAGYLPLRVEWRRHWQFRGKPLNSAHRHVHQVLHTTRIERVGDGFYPLAGVVELRSIDASGGPLPTIDELVEGRAFDPPMLVDHELSWEVGKVEPRGGADPSIYRVAFPRGTEIFDEARLGSPQAVAPLRTGEAAPKLRVTRWSDGRQRALADYRGQVVVIYFWMAWQEPCMAPLAVLQELHKEYHSRGLATLGIHVGNIELDELRHALATANTSFPSALDAGTDQTATSTLSAYHIRFYPTTIVIDPQGGVALNTAEKGFGELWQRTAKELGIVLPLPEELSRDETIAIQNKIYRHLLESRLRRLLPAR